MPSLKPPRHTFPWLVRTRLFARLGLVAALLVACGDVFNDPYPAAERGQSILYSAFTERPKHLDPVQSFSENEAVFLYQVVEPPLQYHYLKRPYTLEPGVAREMPQIRYFAANGEALKDASDLAKVAKSVVEIKIRPGVRWQPHPAFARDAKGGPRYLLVTPEDLSRVESPMEFPALDTRELTAEDFVYGMKRLAHPSLHSPILELMTPYMPGLKTLYTRLTEALETREKTVSRLAAEMAVLEAEVATLQKAGKKPEADMKAQAVTKKRQEYQTAAKQLTAWLDLDQFPLEGVEIVNAHTYRITLQGLYPQFQYWLTMPFFAPMPREVDRFFSQPGMAEKNFTLDYWPVGTGPYMLIENNPNSRMVLQKNPNYRADTYPCEGEAGDREIGLLKDCGKQLPFIDKVVFSRERESIPTWNKFLQGYYDAAGISSDNFDQAVNMGGQGEVTLSDDMKARGITLSTSVSASVFYLGFNMRDPLVGSQDHDPKLRERRRLLRLALANALDVEEYISIFLNGRGIAAMQPIPPGVFGAHEGEAGINPQVYEWREGKARRQGVAEARRLLAAAGWPNGRDAVTGEPLIINLDSTDTGMGSNSVVAWLTKQFRQLGVQFVPRPTDWNRFQDKLLQGNAQLFLMGWNADYPDPENLLFLLYGPQAKAGSQGNNAANYINPEYDKLFDRMKLMPDGAERQVVIDKMVEILRHDSPWIFWYHPKDYVLRHSWLQNRKPSVMVRNYLKYQGLDVEAREQARKAWNQPSKVPLVLAGLLVLSCAIPAFRLWRRHESAIGRESGIGEEG